MKKTTAQIECNYTFNKIAKELNSSLSDTKKEKVLLSIFAEYKHNLINKGYVVLTRKLGVIHLVKFKKRSKVLNYELTKEEGKPIYLSNIHTDGMIYTINWHKPRFSNYQFYTFKPARLLTRALAKNLLEVDAPVLINPKNFLREQISVRTN
jgi:hypothetical protein